MPVRIYDIAKKHGIESKQVLAKAKELGIIGAKVPSSTLDKITAEYLEQFLPPPPPPKPIEPPPPPAVTAPEAGVAPATVSAPPPVVAGAGPPPTTAAPLEPAPLPGPGVTGAAPATALEAAMPTEAGVAAAPLGSPVPTEAPAAPSAPGPVPVPGEPTAGELPAALTTAAEAIGPLPSAGPVALVSGVSGPVPAAPLPALPPPAITLIAPPPLPPPPPPPPRIGDKVGFVLLPAKPTPRGGEKTGPAKAPVKPTPSGRAAGLAAVKPEPRGGVAGRGPAAPGRPSPDKPLGPAVPKFMPPSDGILITMKPPIIVRDLAEQIKRKPHQVIADLMGMNVFAVVNQAIDEAVAQRICAKFGFRLELQKRHGQHPPVMKKPLELDAEDKLEDLRPRAPVVTIMGHVDHGKTTLLDVIRASNVAAGEAGGITQHIGAYTISFPHPEDKKRLQQITFLDTPGHAAFSAMRARGANVTDLVVLVVAANDGVMPQTVEAINHAQAAKVPIMVAVNKCDHPNANPMKVRQQLQDKGLVPDDWGGNTTFVDVSALTKQGVDKLLELILLQAELMGLKANPNRRAKGNVIESGLEPGGPTATVLVRHGTLRVGQIVICGEYYGKVRALISEEGKRLKEAGPSVAVKILGLNGVPEAGLEFSVSEEEKGARELAEKRAEEARLQGQEARAKVTLENLFATLESTQAKVLKVVVKADMQGSVEAIVEALKKIESAKVSLEIIHSAVGTVTESDVHLASASKAIILGFHTRIDNGVTDIAKREGVQIKLYAIIYELIDEVKEAMAGLLEPIVKEVIIGVAEVRKTFALSKGGNVAGCVVLQGRIVKGKLRVTRRKNLVFEGVSQSLRRFQDEVNEVRAGMECGIRVDGFNDFQPGDNLECYHIEKVAPKL